MLIWVQLSGRPAPFRIWEGKNRQNSARFLTASEFDREYLRNGWRYWKSEEQVINCDPSHVRQKN